MPFLIHHISKDSKAWPFTPLGRLYPSLLEGVQNSKLLCRKMSRGSSPWLVGCMWPHMTMNATQHKIINLLKTLWDFFVITCHNVFNMWPKTTLLLPVWPRDAKRLDTAGPFWPNNPTSKNLSWRYTSNNTNMQKIIHWSIVCNCKHITNNLNVPKLHIGWINFSAYTQCSYYVAVKKE